MDKKQKAISILKDHGFFEFVLFIFSFVSSYKEFASVYCKEDDFKEQDFHDGITFEYQNNHYLFLMTNKEYKRDWDGENPWEEVNFKIDVNNQTVFSCKLTKNEYEYEWQFSEYSIYKIILGNWLTQLCEVYKIIESRLNEEKERERIKRDKEEKQKIEENFDLGDFE